MHFSLNELVEEDVGLSILKDGVQVPHLHPFVIKPLPLIIAVHRITYVVATMGIISNMLHNGEEAISRCGAPSLVHLIEYAKAER